MTLGPSLLKATFLLFKVALKNAEQIFRSPVTFFFIFVLVIAVAIYYGNQ